MLLFNHMNNNDYFSVHEVFCLHCNLLIIWYIITIIILFIFSHFIPQDGVEWPHESQHLMDISVMISRNF